MPDSINPQQDETFQGEQPFFNLKHLTGNVGGFRAGYLMGGIESGQV